MRTRITAAFGATVLLLAACVPSVNPFYTDEDVEFDPALLGEWVEDEDIWLFEQFEDLERAYGLTLTSDGKTGTFVATLFSIGDERFLDLLPVEVEYAEDTPDLTEVAMIPGHLALHVRAIEPRLELALMDPDWVEEFLDENPRALRHRRDGDRTILTGETRELQRLLRRHLNDGLFDSDYSEMEKTTE